MIRHLYIKDYVIIDELNIDFKEGFSVFTGETGAGKSIIIDAISLLCGERLSSNVVRSGAKKAVIEAVITIDHPIVKQLLEEAGFELTESEEAAFQKKIDEYVKEYKAGMKADASDYAKVKYTYEYLINNTDYVLDSEYNQNICSVMAYHKSVCLGYAKSMQYLLNEVGVKSTIVEGIAASGEAHAWNMVQIGGAYYYTDVTWGDSSYTNGNSVVKVLSGINYDFLNITTDELEHTHTIDNVVPVPQCVEIADNYYVREGLYFDFINTNALSWVFKNAFERGDDHVTVKCANDTVFQEMKFYLLEEQNIFEYLPEGTETLSYGENPEMHTITFILKSQN